MTEHSHQQLGFEQQMPHTSRHGEAVEVVTPAQEQLEKALDLLRRIRSTGEGAVSDAVEAANMDGVAPEATRELDLAGILDAVEAEEGETIQALKFADEKNPDLLTEAFDDAVVAGVPEKDLELVAEGVEAAIDEAEVLALPEALGERIAEAYETSSFERSPELQEAIKTYYEDHYRLARVIEGIIDGVSIRPEAVDGKIDNYFLRETAKKLLLAKDRGAALFAAEEVIHTDLFKENAVGLETLTEVEQDLARNLAEKLRQRAVQEGLAVAYESWDTKEVRYDWAEGIGHLPQYSSRELRKPTDIVVPTQFDLQELWNDTRHAGQLEFHNSSRLAHSAREGFVLRSRTRQKELTGSFYSQMGVVHGREGANMHSNLVHFSETYSHDEYKAQLSGHGNRQEDEPLSAATAAVPLAEIITVAPYARDAEYAVLEFKNPTDLAKVPILDKIGSIGSQGSDNYGLHGEDRVFMKDYREAFAHVAANYDIEFGHTGMVLMTETEKATGMTFGHGEGYAREVVIPDIQKPQTNLSDEEFRLRVKEARRPQEEAIRQLQRQSRERQEYRGKVIVPLRRGIFEFIPEASSSGSRTKRSEQLKKVAQHSPAA